jgi:succinate-semialdehyde dehydrogenase/glutarate-semialdehyde dehydrogenase
MKVDWGTTGAFVDGRWRTADGAHFDVNNPANGSTLAQFRASSTDECIEAVECAAEALVGWRAVSPRDRAEVLRRAFDNLQTDLDILAETIVQENGKSLTDARAEARYAIEFFRWFSEEAVRIGGDFRVSPSGDKRIIVAHEPIGVSLLVTPWNYPAAMATRKLAPALAAGCTVVLKPSKETPLSAALVVDALARAGIPRGVVNLVVPEHTSTSIRAMLRHPAVRKLSFTGSTEVGRTLLRECAENVVSASMELGGNAPFVVLPGADIDRAVEGAVIAKLRNGGAACTAANRFYVHSSLHDEFSRRLASRLAALQVGPGLDPASDLGALVSEEEASKVRSLVQHAIDHGAKEITGVRRSSSGAFHEALVLVDVEHGTPINREEIFGPVAAIVRYDDVDHAIGMANDSIHGLIAYVFGPEQDSLRVAHRIEAGMVAVNRGLLSDPAAPFGGVKQSGLGREGGHHGVLEFLEVKYIATEL